MKNLSVHNVTFCASLKNKNNGVLLPHNKQLINEDNYLKLFTHSCLFWRSTVSACVTQTMWFKNCLVEDFKVLFFSVFL